MTPRTTKTTYAPEKEHDFLKNCSEVVVVGAFNWSGKDVQSDVELSRIHLLI